jgi:hypothetical protein
MATAITSRTVELLPDCYLYPIGHREFMKGASEEFCDSILKDTSQPNSSFSASALHLAAFDSMIFYRRIGLFDIGAFFIIDKAWLSLDLFRFVFVLLQLPQSYDFCFMDYLCEALSKFHDTSLDKDEIQVLYNLQLMVSVLSRSPSVTDVVIDLFSNRILQLIQGRAMTSEAAQK